MAQVYVGHPCPYCGNTGYKPTESVCAKCNNHFVRRATF